MLFRVGGGAGAGGGGGMHESNGAYLLVRQVGSHRTLWSSGQNHLAGTFQSTAKNSYRPKLLFK